MAQQSKITSRPLTKALGTASILGMAIAGANFANAIQTDFGVEYRATAFAVQNEAADEGTYDSDTDDGLAHLIRLKGNFKHESGVSLITSVELAGDRWTGDGRRGTGTGNLGAYNSGNTGDNVRLDLGYIQVPLGGNLLRVGRQAANWNNCFLVCDDRRDRISGIFPTSIGTVVALYDRRQDTARNQNQDDGDMVAAGLVTKVADMDAGFLWVHWLKDYEGGVADPGFPTSAEVQLVFNPTNNPALPPNGTPVSQVPGGYSGPTTTINQPLGGEGAAGAYVLQDVHLISPYINGSLGDALDFSLGFNYVFNGGVEAQDTDSPDTVNSVFPMEDNDQYFTESSWSQYVRLGTSVGVADLDFQYVGTQDGGLVSSGFDTYASAINSNPESTASAASVYTMGSGLGRKDFDETLFIGRATFNVTPQFKLMGSVGHLNIDSGDDDDSSMVYDLQAHYQVNDVVKTWLTAGMLTDNEVGSLSGNNLAGVGGDWENDDALSVTANLSVNF